MMARPRKRPVDYSCDCCDTATPADDLCPPTLLELARRCRVVVEAARRDLGREAVDPAMLDLVADQIEDAPLDTLSAALVVAGLR